MAAKLSILCEIRLKMSLIGDICNFSCIISFQNAHPECVHDISCHPSTEVHYHEGNLQKNMLKYIKNFMKFANFGLFCPLKGLKPSPFPLKSMLPNRASKDWRFGHLGRVKITVLGKKICKKWWKLGEKRSHVWGPRKGP